MDMERAESQLLSVDYAYVVKLPYACSRARGRETRLRNGGVGGVIATRDKDKGGRR